MTTLYASAALLPEGVARDVRIEVENGQISSISTGENAQPSDERHTMLLPGVANLHSHAFQRAMAGLAERRGSDNDSFWSWRTTMYKLALSMTPDDVEAVAAQLYVEMLEGGFTRVGEFHYLHHDKDGSPYANVAEMAERIVAASLDAGIGLTLLPVFYAHAGFGPKPPSEGQRRFINDIDRFEKLLSASRAATRQVKGGRIGVAPHSLRAATLSEIRQIVALPHDGPTHIHVAEQVLEVEDCLAATGARPVELLLANIDVTSNWCLIHATHLNDSEVAAMATRGAVAGLCPITEANLGDGIFRAVEFTAAGGRYGVGSDSNIQISLADELRQLEYSQRYVTRGRNVFARPNGSTAEALILGAASGGAHALGGDGMITAGAPADLVSLDVASAPYLALENILDSFVFGSGVRIRDVWVGGCKVVEGGRHRNGDAIRKRFNKVMGRLVST